MSFPPDKNEIREWKRIIFNDQSFPHGSGWRREYHRADSVVPVFVNRQRGLIIKEFAFLLGEETKGITLPTIWLNQGMWALQPLCTFDDRPEAFAAITKAILAAGYSATTFDCHYWNVGRWKGKPYLFDW